jgi:hypothetical protein
MVRFAKTTGVLAIVGALTCAVAAAQQPANYVVRGQVRAANNSPVAGHIVRLANKGLARETALGQAVTDAAGRYQISYSTSQMGGQQNRAAVIVRVFAPSGASAALVQSEVIHTVTPAMTVNLTVIRAPAARRQSL